MKGRNSCDKYPEPIQEKVQRAALAVKGDPVRLSEGEMATLGHVPMSAVKAIRLMCIDCMGAVPPFGGGADIERCTSVGCPLWPFRFGVTPWGKQAKKAKRRLLEQEP